MSEPLPDGVSHKDFDELRGVVSDLADALKQQREAETSREKHEAKEEVKEARADLDQLAKEMGVDPGKLREAAEKAKHDAEKERLRPLLLELLDEELASDDDKPADEPDEKNDDEEDEPADEKPADEPPAPPEDSAPTAEHWSERTVGRLLG